jgi:hypothetical protein
LDVDFVGICYLVEMCLADDTSENMGTGAGTVTTAANTFQNNATLTHSGDAGYKGYHPSGYTGSSG